MPTFSSVVRKPGQTIKPKVAPRRNAQRQAQKATPAAAALTPNSIPQSPNLQPASQSRPSSEDLSSQSVSNLREEGPTSILTPPPSARDTINPPPEIEDTAVPPETALSPPPTHIESTSRRTSDGTPQASSSEPQSFTRPKRRAEAVEDAATLSRPSSELEDSRISASRTAAVSVPTNKRRKVAPQAAPSYLLSRPSELTNRARTETPLNQRATPSAEERARASTEDLLQQATAQFGSVSKIADSIENRTRNLRPRSGRASTSYTEVEDDNDEDEDHIPRQRRSQRSIHSRAIEDLAADVVNQATGRSRKARRREPFVEDPENHEIDVDVVSMKDLVKDKGLGKRSETGKQLDDNWTEIQQRWKEGPEENRRKAREKTQAEKQARKQQRGKDDAQNPEGSLQRQQPESGPVLQAMIINGMLVKDVNTTIFDRGNNIEDRAQQQETDAREYRKVDNYVNQARVGKNAGLRSNGTRWTIEETELFYKGLRMFGTDFEMIASLFPSKRRKEIKDMYTRELRLDAKRVETNLANRETWALEEYAEMIGRGDESWESPEELKKELAAIEQRITAEHAARKADGQIADAADIPIPSTEIDANGNEIVREDTEAHAVDERSKRLQSMAGRVVAAAVAPAAQKRAKQRKARDTSKVTKSKKGKPTLAGVEEVIGSTKDVER